MISNSHSWFSGPLVSDWVKESLCILHHVQVQHLPCRWIKHLNSSWVNECIFNASVTKSLSDLCRFSSPFLYPHRKVLEEVNSFPTNVDIFLSPCRFHDAHLVPIIVKSHQDRSWASVSMTRRAGAMSALKLDSIIFHWHTKDIWVPGFEELNRVRPFYTFFQAFSKSSRRSVAFSNAFSRSEIEVSINVFWS